MELGKADPRHGARLRDVAEGERERPERQKPQGVEYRRVGSLADRFVVVVKLL
jgi:hypothetical protein